MTYPATIILNERGILSVISHECAGDGGGDSVRRDMSKAGS